MHSSNALLNDIVHTAYDGVAFYQSASSKVQRPELREAFTRMAAVKKDLIAELTGPDLPAPENTTVTGAVREMYANVRALLSGNDDAVYVSQLEEVEDRLLDEIQVALLETTDAATKASLQNSLPRMRACHDEMRALKHRMAN